MLVVLGGLPGTGKTTIGKAFAAGRRAVYLRIDAIEQALRGWAPAGQEMGPQGYIVAKAVALSNLRIGNWVVADSVNPVPESRQGWRAVAAEARSPMLEIEVICSDLREHRRRVEERVADIAGHGVPDWASVRAHEYVAWTEPRLVLDSFVLSASEAIAKIEAHLLQPTR